MTLFSVLTLIFIVCIMSAWLYVFVQALVNFQRYSYNVIMLLALVLWPCILFDDMLLASANAELLVHLSGFFNWVAPISMLLILVCIYKITLVKASVPYVMYVAPCVIVALSQIPYIILSATQKQALFIAPIGGDLQTFWVVYVSLVLSALMVVFFAYKAEELWREFKFHLPEQVADPGMFNQPYLPLALGSVTTLVFASIILMALIVFDVVQWSYWQTVVRAFLAAPLLLLLYILTRFTHFSPSPFSADSLYEEHPEKLLKDTLARAEHAIIYGKAYKKMGVTIAQLSHMAKTDPATLAIALKTILKKNFRMMIYHYRLEYAKKVLAESDRSVSQVAKKLGFHSEQYLSKVFNQYMKEQKGREEVDIHTILHAKADIHTESKKVKSNLN